MAWITPIVTWGQSGQTVPGVADFNRIEGNILELYNTKETPAGAQTKVNTHADDVASLSVLGHVKHAVLTATLDTEWEGSAAPYSQSVSVSGILATDTPIIDVVMSGTYSTDETRLEAWGYVYRAVTANNSITFYAFKKPSVELPIQMRVVR